MKNIILILSLAFLVGCNCNSKKCGDQTGIADTTKVNCCDSLSTDSTKKACCKEAEKKKCCKEDSTATKDCCKKEKKKCCDKQ